MSHFYRFFTINDPSAEKCGIGCLGVQGELERLPSLPVEFWRAREEVEAWPQCKVMRIPAVPETHRKMRYVFKRQPGVVLPDVWCWAELLLVSERAKTVLASLDDFGHEFIAVEVTDQDGNAINTTPCYAMNVRRLLHIEELGGEIRNKFEMFCPNYLEGKYLPVVQHNAALKDKIAQLPIWRHIRNQYVHYINEPTLRALEAAGVSGLRPYSTYDGQAGEAIGRFE